MDRTSCDGLDRPGDRLSTDERWENLGKIKYGETTTVMRVGRTASAEDASGARASGPAPLAGERRFRRRPGGHYSAEGQRDPCATRRQRARKTLGETWRGIANFS